MTQLLWWTAVVWWGGGGGDWSQCGDENESRRVGEKKKWCRGFCCVTYERLWKALFKEDAGRADDVVQDVAVLHQSTEGIVARLILLLLLLLLLFLLLSLLAHWPPLTILYPLQRQTRLLLDHSVSQVPSTWLLHTWNVTSFKEQVTRRRLSGHANIRQNVAVSLRHISCLIFQGDHWHRLLTLLRDLWISTLSVRYVSILLQAPLMALLSV